VAAVLDGGRCDGTPSTVISVRADEVKCLREGAIPFSEIAELAAGTKP
jgi:tRNA A37 threonylcarbamoyladenosine synthetase subunit TsaC/SUA5/YrdC